MHLEKYLKEAGSSQADFGRELVPPASQALVSQWIRGVTRITLDYALQIDRISCGKVSPQDCQDMFIGSNRPAERKDDSEQSSNGEDPGPTPGSLMLRTGQPPVFELKK